MMKSILPFHRVMLLLTFATAAPLFAAEKGWVGMGLDVKLGINGSLLSPVVALASVKSIAPNSPAAGQKIAVGDSLVEIEGLVVPRCKGSALKAKLTVEPGKTVRLKFKRANGEIYEVELTTVPKPR